MQRPVVTYGLDRLSTHEVATHVACARQIAALTEASFGGDYPSCGQKPDDLFFVPSRTLLTSEARQLQICDEGDLFGGVVPARFVGTKAISHPLVGADPFAPPEWSHEFEGAVRDVVLKGLTVFSMRDAQRVGEKLVELGPVRVKPTGATGSTGQSLVTNSAELTSALADVDDSEMARCGLVFEENLTDCRTFSVGVSRVAGLTIAYYGSQRPTKNNRGESVYGGSDLCVIRGHIPDLIDEKLPKQIRLAVDQAWQFDKAVDEFYPAMFASRRNYDVAQGVDWQGKRRSGVLEQSWRIGGATPAELVALAALKADPALRSVRTSSVEIYGTDRSSIPPDATIYFEGIDEKVGPMIKYAVRHAD
jgi:uncharacterized protein DUF3182